MTFTDLLSEVYTLTGRPDRTAETSSAIKAATLKAHQSDYFYKDIFETGVVLDSAAFEVDIEYRTLVPRFRAMKYLRKYDLTNSAVGTFLELIPPENVLDYFKIQKQDVYYLAGAMMHVNSSTQESAYLMGCYLHPDISNFNSWIATDHPYAIIYDAAATVFKAIGKDEEAAAFRNLVGEQMMLLRASNIVANGF